MQIAGVKIDHQIRGRLQILNQRAGKFSGQRSAVFLTHLAVHVHPEKWPEPGERTESFRVHRRIDVNLSLKRLGPGGLQLTEPLDDTVAKVHPFQFVPMQTGHKRDALDRLVRDRGEGLPDDFNRPAQRIFTGCDFVSFQSCFPVRRCVAFPAIAGFMILRGCSFF